MAWIPDRGLVVSLSGALDRAGAAELDQALAHVLATFTDDVTLDLSSCHSVGPAGQDVVSAAVADFRRRGRRLRLEQPSVATASGDPMRSYS